MTAFGAVLIPAGLDKHERAAARVEAKVARWGAVLHESRQGEQELVRRVGRRDGIQRDDTGSLDARLDHIALCPPLTFSQGLLEPHGRNKLVAPETPEFRRYHPADTEHVLDGTGGLVDLDLETKWLVAQDGKGMVSSAKSDKVMSLHSGRSMVATVFRALSDDTRLQMLVLLGKREFCVCEFVELFGISQSATSEHLRRLKDAGLATDERRGMWVFYRLQEQLPAFVTAALQSVELQPAIVERLDRLQPARAACARTPQDRSTVFGAAR